MAVPGTRRRENTRARLLDAAAAIFSEVGVAGASVEMICERAGFTRGAFYSNFESKNELFLELMAQLIEQHFGLVRARIDELIAAGALDEADDPFFIVREVLDVAADDRASIVMSAEIKLHALRDREFGEAYLNYERMMQRSVEELIELIRATGSFILLVDVSVAARTLMMLWEAASIHAAISIDDEEGLKEAAGEALSALTRLIAVDARAADRGERGSSPA